MISLKVGLNSSLKSLHDLLLRHDLMIAFHFNLKIGDNMERFLAIVEDDSAKKKKLNSIIVNQREDGKLALHAREGQMIFAVILISAVIERLSLLEDDRSFAVTESYVNMIKDETHYRFGIKGRHGKFFRDFVIDRITPGAGEQGRHEKFLVLLSRWFGLRLWKKDKSNFENLLKMVRNIECKVHMSHLN